MKLFHKVGIVGVGLIGGSIAAAIREKKLADKIIGVARHKDTLRFAKRQHLIDEGALDIHILKDVDILILACPVETIIRLAESLSGIVKKDCLVIDVGSTKEKIVNKLQKIFSNFVGCHPLAGSEKRGIANSKSVIFKDSLCILTPTAKTHSSDLKKVKIFWERLGTRTAVLDPSAHDKIISYTSHLPHIVAFSLISTVPVGFLRFAASGLRDTTRIASSESSLWTDILLSNRSCLNSIEDFQISLSQIKKAIQKGNKKSLLSLLKKAKNKRGKLG